MWPGAAGHRPLSSLVAAHPALLPPATWPPDLAVPLNWAARPRPGLVGCLDLVTFLDASPWLQLSPLASAAAGRKHLVRSLCASKVGSKPSKPGVSTPGTAHCQVSKLGLEQTEEPEIKLPTFAGS